ncbi:MAG TPA: AraC family transcriptional regulator ligand-binding domain-containing protein [Steroidobacteraceae bacterium]|nr:AraC family transcriptional regulator ligand-binding domain-containing protein [Steroidobacteraceae bacterium]
MQMDIHAKVIPLRLHPLGFIEAFSQLGASIEGLLDGTGIAKHHLEYSAAKISYYQQRVLIRNGFELCRRPGLGLLVGQLFNISFYGTAGYVVHCSPTLRDAAEVFRRYTMLAQPYYALSTRKADTYVDENRQLVYSLECFPTGEHCPPGLVEFELEYRLASTLLFWDACGNKSVANPSVHVALAIPEPAHAAMYRALPCSTVRFGCARSQMSADIDFFLKPFRLYRKHTFDNLVARCEAELREAALDTSCTALVRWHLFANFNKQMTLEAIAEALHMTARGLARQLAMEKTSFRAILHEVRMELTSYHLRASKLSVDEISELMGFSSASSLRRAIRNWTGTAAGSVRSSGSQIAVHEQRVA